MVAAQELLDYLLHMRAELSSLFFGVMDLKERHAELGLRIMGVEGGELPDAGQFPMSSIELAVFVEHLDHLLRGSHPDCLAHVDKGDRVEVFLHLDMTIGMDFSRAPLTELGFPFPTALLSSSRIDPNYRPLPKA